MYMYMTAYLDIVLYTNVLYSQSVECSGGLSADELDLTGAYLLETLGLETCSYIHVHISSVTYTWLISAVFSFQ